MTSDNVSNICVLPGDGIGVEVMPPMIALLQRAAVRVNGLDLRFEEYRTGAFACRDTGTAPCRSVRRRHQRRRRCSAG